MKLIPTATAAKTLGLRDAFEASAVLSQAGFNVVRIDSRNFVSADSIAEYAAEIA